MLASRIDALRIDLGKLVSHEKLWSGVDKTRETLIADIPRLSMRIQELIEESKRDIVLDSHYAFDVVPAKTLHVVFVLRRDPDELREFMRKRELKGKKLKENLAAEVLDVCLFNAVAVSGVDNVSEIDCTGKETETVVEEMIAVLEGREPRRVGIVDWLGKLEREGRLEEVLEDF